MEMVFVVALFSFSFCVCNAFLLPFCSHGQLSEVFEQEIDPVMQSLGYCCGRKYTFNPQVLCCYGKQLCTIPRDAKYYSFQNRSVLPLKLGIVAQVGTKLGFFFLSPPSPFLCGYQYLNLLK
jgi:hypothetical protein